jgi:hypothetical protein
VIVSVSLVTGPLYVWLTTGVSPLIQVREGGWPVVFVIWPIVGSLFATMHVFAAFVEGGVRARAGIAGITVCLCALWLLALRRGRAHENSIVGRWLGWARSGRTRG